MRRFIARILDATDISNRYLYLYIACLILSLSLAAGAEVPAMNNHFQPNDNHLPTPPPSQQIDPLKAYPTAQYIVHGVLVMEDNAVAVVYTPRNTWHKLYVNSHLGEEQAVVRQITTQGIQIDMQDTLLWLPILQ